MIHHYLEARKIVLSKYSDSIYYPMMVVGLYSLLEKYPEYEEMIISLFSSCEIIIEEDTISNIIKKHNLSFLAFDQEDSNDSETFGLSSSEDIVLFENGDLVSTKRAPLVLCSSIDRSPTELLNIFLHEMNHLIKGVNNSFYFHQENEQSYYACRTGFHTYYYQYDKPSGNLWEYDEFNILDEVINTIQSTELTENVFSLKEFIVDEEIVNYFYSLDEKEARKDFGYEEVTRLFRPFWDYASFKDLIENNIIEGHIPIIIQEYEEIMGKDSFEGLSIALEIIDQADQRQRHGKKYKYAKKYLKNAIKRFPKEKRKVYQ